MMNGFPPSEQTPKRLSLDEFAEIMAKQASEALQAADRKWGRHEPVDLDHFDKTGEIRPRAKAGASATQMS